MVLMQSRRMKIRQMKKKTENSLPVMCLKDFLSLTRRYDKDEIYLCSFWMFWSTVPKENSEVIISMWFNYLFLLHHERNR